MQNCVPLACLYAMNGFVVVGEIFLCVLQLHSHLLVQFYNFSIYNFLLVFTCHSRRSLLGIDE